MFAFLAMKQSERNTENFFVRKRKTCVYKTRNRNHGDSSLRNLRQYLDQGGIMRIGGRLNLSVFPIEQRKFS